MVTTTQSSGVFWSNDETNQILYRLAWYRTPIAIIKEYYGIQDSDLTNTKKLEKMGVKWTERLWELWVTKDTFNSIFNEVLYDTEWESQTSSSNSIEWTEGKSSVSNTAKRAWKSKG